MQVFRLESQSAKISKKMSTSRSKAKAVCNSLNGRMAI
jgi:hypothetical protein